MENKPWEERTYEELAKAADSGRVGQGGIVETNRRLVEALREFSTESSRQAGTMIRLTRWIIVLTVVLGIIAALQLWAMLKGGA